MPALQQMDKTMRRGAYKRWAMDRRRLMMGYLLALAGTALFSSKAIFVKLAYAENADALLVLTWRMIFSLPFFAAVCIGALVLRRREGMKPIPAGMIVRILMLGVFGYLAMILDFEGLVHVSAGLERLVLFTYPVFLILLAAAFFGARLTAGNLVAAGVSYAGLALVFLADLPDGGSNVPLGTLLVLASALSIAIYQLWATGLISSVGSILFTALALSGTSLASLAHFFVLRGASNLAVSPRYLLLAALTGIFATVVPSFMINAGMARIGAQSTAMISMVSPLLTIYLAVLMLNESFTLIDALGTALVLGGMGYDAWAGLRRKPPQAIDI